MKPILFLLLSAGLAAAGSRQIDLAGSWSFALDSTNKGHGEQWFLRTITPDVMFLPGSTDQAGYGVKVVEPDTGWLTRSFKYEGPAWYQREVVIPENWRGLHIVLFLERPHWQTEVWVDGVSGGTRNSLSTPHEYDLSAALTPGRHRITLCVDNTYKIDVGRNAHSVTEHTQTNWNGIVGEIALHASDPVWIDSTSIASDVEHKVLRVTCVIRNATGAPLAAEITAKAAGLESHVTQPVRVSAETSVTLTLPVPDAKPWDDIYLPVPDAKPWDDIEPSLYTLDLSLAAGRYSDQREIPFGVRGISTRGTQFLLNGRPVFLRGTVECNIFPLTGYPPTKVEAWERIFRIARSYGLNAFRFHSYCPPEAAFTAADRTGFLLHVELPVWNKTVGKDPVLSDYMRAEGYRILKAYGNHPSFTMLCLGNELIGDDRFMDALVAEFKKADPRRLYTFSADHVRRAPGPTSDYYVTQQTSVGRLRINGTRFTRTEEGTDHDFAPSVAAVHVPLVTHEMGQWAVFPDFGEIAKYTGVLKARNLEPFRDSLMARSMIDEAHDFQVASGKFSWAVYKEDMEAALRTPNYGGFFLLQLEDFPGQGEALVGVLDSFWDSKGILTPEEFRQFSSPTVPLLRMKKFVWTSGEPFIAHAEVAHYGRAPMTDAAASWRVVDDRGHAIASGNFPRVHLPLGSVTALGEINLPLAACRWAASQLSARSTCRWRMWPPRRIGKSPSPSPARRRATVATCGSILGPILRRRPLAC
ncbi:fragment of glycoside hydrolase family 2 protein [Candidatus Sulfopaludibacter sp. SbA3]|nr:fragment of glycoside hydrolase family 2 protein [Candidatus Sulfopaludibacter sp. SbA3]